MNARAQIEAVNFKYPVLTKEQAEAQRTSITCPACKRTSYNLNDVKERYCGFCHEWHSNMHF